jgi:P63C domain
MVAIVCKGKIEIKGLQFGCAVLTDGSRVIFRPSIKKLFSKLLKENQSLFNFLESEILFLLDEELASLLTNPILLKLNTGKKIGAYNAKILALLCKSVVEASNEEDFKPQYKELANCMSLICAELACMSIEKLIDEATGYAIYKPYLSNEVGKWKRRFMQSDLKHIYRLKGKTFFPGNKTGRWVGKPFNEAFYESLEPGLPEILKIKNPARMKNKRRQYKHHQFLIKRFGKENLEAHIEKIRLLLATSIDWNDFVHRLELFQIQKRNTS